MSPDNTGLVFVCQDSYSVLTPLAESRPKLRSQAFTYLRSLTLCFS